MQRNRYAFQILLILEFSRLVFEKYSNIKLHENLPSGRRFVPRGRTDRRDEAEQSFLLFCERA